jgi:hypothetical protein
MIAMAMVMGVMTLMMNNTTDFNDDDMTTELREYRGRLYETAPVGNLDTITMAVSNANGLKSNVHKVRKLARILQGGVHDCNLPEVQLLGVVELATKSKDAAEKPFFEDRGLHVASADVEEMQAMTDNLCPAGRFWATKHTALCASAELNGLVIRVEASCDGRELTARVEINGQHYALVVAYMHGGDPKYRQKQFTRLSRALSRLPDGVRMLLGGDLNIVMDPLRDIKNATHVYGKSDNKGIVECRRMMEENHLAEY